MGPRRGTPLGLAYRGNGNGAGTEREESEREPTRRRLAALFAAISSEITARFTCTLAVAGANFEDTQRMRRELLRRVIARDPNLTSSVRRRPKAHRGYFS